MSTITRRLWNIPYMSNTYIYVDIVYIVYIVYFVFSISTWCCNYNNLSKSTLVNTDVDIDIDNIFGF